MNMHANDLSLRALAGAPEPVTWIDAGGVRLAAMRRGRGAPVLCLHAIGHGARDFELLAERVGSECEIIALDWPGQGRSPDDGGPPDPAHYAKLALGALDALGIERAIVLGCSIGGATGLRLAAENPARVRALILCNTGGLLAQTPFLRFAIARFVSFFRAGENGKAWYARAFAFYYRRVLAEKPSWPQRDRIIASAYEIAGVLRRAFEGFGRPEADVRALAPKIRCPVWFAWAMGDKINVWSRTEPSVKTFANAKVQMFRGGHAAFLEDPDNFAKAFLAFVRGV